MTTRIWIVMGLLVGAAAAESCSSKDQLLQTHDAGADVASPGSGGSTATGGGTGASPTGGAAGHLASGGTAGPGGRGGAGTGGAATGGAATGGRGGVAGAGVQVGGSGGQEIAPVPCGLGMCAFGLRCCVACDGSMTCAGSCTGIVCPTDAGADAGPPITCGGRTCGTDEVCCGPASCGTCTNALSGAHCPTVCGPLDSGADAAPGSIPCGNGSCGPLEACVHPARGGTCTMPDAGVCPVGTTVQGGCCLPPDDPKCVTIDRACDGPTVTCACFTKDPCGVGCGSASITGRDVACAGA